MFELLHILLEALGKCIREGSFESHVLEQGDREYVVTQQRWR